ncbi:hypothetical protein [Alkalicoccobacillus murimartini]|uniref:Uncharacterized protein n=1 Tax=Alkalicoccobacillus murimartini TaxID=171685 RepID=A0ABT9YJM5_9BACI|nr:hypothetical protein [Alkalicoccobacillus murimartini]MDQ0207417.1 hypothetical protein [Alkalicoccobacillus murimartini]
MERILNNHREDYEFYLMAIAILSVLTFRKIKKLERYKLNLKEQLDQNKNR